MYFLFATAQHIIGALSFGISMEMRVCGVLVQTYLQCVVNKKARRTPKDIVVRKI